MHLQSVRVMWATVLKLAKFTHMSGVAGWILFLVGMTLALLSIFFIFWQTGPGMLLSDDRESRAQRYTGAFQTSSSGVHTLEPQWPNQIPRLSQAAKSKRECIVERTLKNSMGSFLLFLV
jgi:hypothetical protein